jgi:hypothetical protein
MAPALSLIAAAGMRNRTHYPTSEHSRCESQWMHYSAPNNNYGGFKNGMGTQSVLNVANVT